MAIRYLAEYIGVGNPSTPQVFFEYLAHFNDEDVRRRAAEANRCSPQLLYELAHDCSSEVRIAVCHNINTPVEVLQFLAMDEDTTVRFSLATNPRLPLALMHQLENDENPYVAWRASKTLNRVMQN